MPRELLIGCGNSRAKKVYVAGDSDWHDLTTLDHSPACQPDVLWELERLPLPFQDATFSEIHAYEVLEHLGAQGDYRYFFHLFSDLWRLLEPQGLICATVPHWKSMWAWGDPSHTRVITTGTLTFLRQPSYEEQVGRTDMTDFRHLYRADFEPIYLDDGKSDPNKFIFILEARKPARIPNP